MKYKKYVLFITFLWLTIEHAQSNTNELPDIYWNPFEPIFACTVPTINVRIGNKIRFRCPKNGERTSVGYQTSDAPKENMYFIGENEDAFRTCNATSPTAKELFNCTDSNSNYDLNILETAVQRGQPEFTKGKSFYLISTGYRTLQNISQTFGGSCSFSDDGGYKLKLKLYVCTDAEECDSCKSQACYYKDCGNKICSEWSKFGQPYKSNTVDVCNFTETRNCKDDIIGYTVTELKTSTISCPKNCSDWIKDTTEDSISKSGNKCFENYNRTCERKILKEVFTETSRTYVDCPTSAPTFKPPSTTTAASPITLPQVSNDNSTDKDKENMYIAIGATVVFFIIGLMLGAFLHRHFHHRNDVKSSEEALKVYNSKTNGFNNEAFSQYDEHT